MKALIPSMKENKRYLLVKGKDLNHNIPNAIQEFSGMFGMSKSGMSFIKKYINSAIISVNREAVDLVRAAICVYPARMDVEKVSGTLKGLNR